MHTRRDLSDLRLSSTHRFHHGIPMSRPDPISWLKTYGHCAPAYALAVPEGSIDNQKIQTVGKEKLLPFSICENGPFPKSLSWFEFLISLRPIVNSILANHHLGVFWGSVFLSCLWLMTHVLHIMTWYSYGLHGQKTLVNKVNTRKELKIPWREAWMGRGRE